MAIQQTEELLGQTEEVLRPLTYHDIETYPEDSRLRYEIISGELVVSPAAMPDHGQSVLALYDAFKLVVKAGNLGRLWVAPVDVELRAGCGSCVPPRAQSRRDFRRSARGFNPGRRPATGHMKCNPL